MHVNFSTTAKGAEWLEAKGRRLLCVLLIRLNLVSAHPRAELVLCDALKGRLLGKTVSRAV